MSPSSFPPSSLSFAQNFFIQLWARSIYKTILTSCNNISLLIETLSFWKKMPTGQDSNPSPQVMAPLPNVPQPLPKLR